jgi:peptide/nickel transport system substrate-binding protein
MYMPKQSHKLALIGSLLVIFGLILGACAPEGKPTTSTTTTNSGQPVKGGVWVDDLANEPDSLIPNATVQTFAWMVMQALYAPLFTGDPTGHVQPGLATEVPTVENGGVSADAKTWTIHLRPNLKWSDGQPLNAEDVDFTWKLWSNPKFGAGNVVALRHIASADVSADKLSITFHLKDSYAAFLPTWIDGMQAPLPKHYFEKIAPDQIKHSKDNLKPSVVSGPFTMQESLPGDHYTLVRNTNYYRASEGLPYLDKVIFRPVGKQETILKDLQSGAIDSAWFLDSSKLPSYKQLNNYQLTLGTAANYEALHFNQNNPALKDVNVRKAIALAVDHDQLIKVSRLGAGVPICTDHTQVYNPGYQADITCPKFDLDAANKLLDNAGWKKGSDGVRQKGNLRLEFQYATTANNQWREQDEIINQANFQKIGVKINIQNYPASTFFGTFLKSGKAGQYDMAEWASSYSYDADDAANFSCDQIGKDNFNWYCNPKLDDLFTQEQATADPAKRQQIFNQIHAIMLTDFPVTFLFSPNDISISKKGTHNYKPGPFGATETVNVWEWWCDGGHCPSAA